MLAVWQIRLNDLGVMNLRPGILFVSLSLLTGCQPGAVRDLDAPVFGYRTETTFVVDASRPVNVHELAHFAKVIRLYKTLTPREIMAIQTQLHREVEDLIAVEMQSMRPAVAQKKRTLETKHRAELQAAKTDPVKSAQLVAAHEATIQRMEADLKQEARERLLARLGKDLALPVLTTDSRSVVAFGRMQGEQFQVTTKAFEIDVAAAMLRTGAKVSDTNGNEATVVGQPKVKLSGP